MRKGYPRTRFNIIDRTNTPEIATETIGSPSVPMPMALYTSDKGPEEWRVITRLSDFTEQTGPMSFTNHGQPQLTVAEELRSGAAVFCKRLVADDATFANATIYATVVLSGTTAYIYYTAKACNPQGSDTTGRSFDTICDWAYNSNSLDSNDKPFASDKYDKDLEDYRRNTIRLHAEKVADAHGETYSGTTGDANIDSLTLENIPLFTITAIGRGVSKLYIRFNPEYTTARTTPYFRYSFEVLEDQDVIENITVSLNPSVLIDGVCQFINPKVKANSKQVNINAYEDGLKVLAKAISCAETADTSTESLLTITDLINLDIINGLTSRGKQIPNVITINTADTASQSLWNDFRPASIDATDTIDICSGTGIPLINGSYGSLTATPMVLGDTDNTRAYSADSDYSVAYTNLLLKELGAGPNGDTDADSVIYDLDAYKPDFIVDCGYPVDVKNAIIALVDYREDLVFLADLGKKYVSLEDITTAATTINESKFTALYHNFFKIYDPYTAKQITVTMPYLLAKRMIKHMADGVARPFSGIRNGITFPEIIARSINFVPVHIPSDDQKQSLIDYNINYISYYDGLPVMETEYIHHSDYTQLSYLHNIMAIQEVIKDIRSHCPAIRYAFIDGSDLQRYIDDTTAVINQYATNFKSISMQYMADEAYEANNIFYATITVRFKNFIQEELFRVVAID